MISKAAGIEYGRGRAAENTELSDEQVARAVRESEMKIEPRILKGFRDYLPPVAMARERLINVLQQVFSTSGFVPIDTPALEYAEILTGKGSDETDKQMYRFQDLGGRDVALRFDLTVPLARFISMYSHEVGLPFRRYHIAPVWRAEKPQKGRYREFVQCDFDILGTKSPFSDAEIVTVIHRAMSTMGAPCTIRLNNRKILNGMLSAVGRKEQSAAVLRAVDKLEKIGPEGVKNELRSEVQLSEDDINQVFAYLSLSLEQLGNRALVDRLATHFSGNPEALTGVRELERVIRALETSGLTDDDCTVDLSIARGLDYYTGSVFETVLSKLPSIGSVCSGGRYDNLASLYSKQEIPGVGASIGLDRLIAGLEELGLLSSKTGSSDVLVTVLDEDTEGASLSLACALQREGIAVSVYPGEAKLGAQLKYGAKIGAHYAIIAGRPEVDRGVCHVKDLQAGEQVDDIATGELAAYFREKNLGRGQ